MILEKRVKQILHRVKWSTMGKEIWQTIYPRKFGKDLAYERRPSVHPLHVKCHIRSCTNIDTSQSSHSYEDELTAVKIRHPLTIIT